MTDRSSRSTCAKSKRELFRYKEIEIECDSILERAAIIFLVDVLKVRTIERFRNLLSFWKEGFRKTFNPDFWIEFSDGRRGIVEVKMKFYPGHEYEYNATIPFKQKVLQEFCNERGYECLWLTFDYDRKLWDIYRNLLSTRGSIGTAVVL